MIVTIIRTAQPTLFTATLAASGIGLAPFFIDGSTPVAPVGANQDVARRRIIRRA